jgi:hypothetical protein
LEIVRAFVVTTTGAASSYRRDLVETVSPGSESRADAKKGHPGTWEILHSPRPEKPAGDNGTITPGL